MPFVLFEISGNQALVGLAVFLGTIPFALMSSFGGVIADRFDRRKVLLISQSLAAVGPILLAIAWSTNHHSPVLIIAILTLGGINAGLSAPSWIAFMTDCVPREIIPNAITLNAAQFNAARGFGPVLAGIVLHAFGPTWAFLINAASFIFVVGALALIKPLRSPERREKRRVWGELADGFKYVRGHSAVFVAMSLGFLLASCGMTVFWLMPSFAKNVFETNSLGYGFLTGAMGLGSIVGVVLISVLTQTWKRSHIVRRLLPLFGLGLLVFSRLHVLSIAVVVLFCCGMLFISLVSVALTTVQYASTDAMRGRVTSSYLMVVTAAFPVGALIEGIVARQFGAPLALSVAASLLLAEGIFFNLFPGVARNLDRAADDSLTGVPNEPEEIVEVVGLAD